MGWRFTKRCLVLVIGGLAAARAIGAQVELMQRSLVTVRQDEVASAHVAVTSVRPWEEYSVAMQPKFDLTAAGALTRVAEATRLEDQRVFDGLGLALQAEAGKTLGGTNAEALSPSNAAVAAGRARDLGSAADLLTNKIVVASSLQYWAATALFQEVQLINRAFRDAVEFADHTPYVVRLQVTVMPRRRAAPFDAITDLSFFVGEPELAYTDKTPTNGLHVVPMLATDSIESALHSQSTERLRSFSLALAAVLPKASLGLGLDRVKDALESAVGRDYNSTFTVARLSGNTVRCRFGALFQTETKHSLVPQNHFVTLLVFVPDSVARSASGSQRTLRIVSNSSLVSVKTGRSVRQLTNQDFIRRFEDYLKVNRMTFAEPPRCVTGCSGQCNGCGLPLNRTALMAGLFGAVAGNDFASFKRLIETNLSHKDLPKGTNVLFPDAVWSELTTFWAGSQFSVAQFQLPKKPLSNEERFQAWRSTSGQRLVAVDDGETMTVVCPGFPRLRDEAVMGELRSSGPAFAHFDKVSSGPATYSDETTQLTLRFPSPALAAKADVSSDQLKLRLSLAAKQRPLWSSILPSSMNLLLREICPVTGNIQVEADAIPLTYIPVKKAKIDPVPSFKLIATTKTIVMDNKGEGSVRFGIQVEPKGTNVTIQGTLVGGSLQATNGLVADAKTKVMQDSLFWKTEKLDVNTTVTLKLEGLNPETEVEIGGKDSANNAVAPVLKFKVIAPPDKKSN